MILMLKGFQSIIGGFLLRIGDLFDGNSSKVLSTSPFRKRTRAEMSAINKELKKNKLMSKEEFLAQGVIATTQALQSLNGQQEEHAKYLATSDFMSPKPDGRIGDDDAKHFDGVYYDDEPLDHGFYQPGDSGGAKTPVKPAVKSTPAPVIQKFATPKKPNPYDVEIAAAVAASEEKAKYIERLTAERVAMAAAVRVVEAQEAREKAERMSASVPKYNSPLPASRYDRDGFEETPYVSLSPFSSSQQTKPSQYSFSSAPATGGFSQNSFPASFPAASPSWTPTKPKLQPKLGKDMTFPELVSATRATGFTGPIQLANRDVFENRLDKYNSGRF